MSANRLRTVPLTPATFLLIRHGHTAAGGRLCGHMDLPLSATGHNEAVLAGAALAGVPLDAVYTSDLTRSRQTAAIIAAPHALPQTIDSGLRERHFGAWEDAHPEQLNTQDPDGLSRLWRDPDFAPPGGETARELTRRALSVMARLTADHPGRTVAVVAHGGPIRAVLAHHLGMPLAASLKVEIRPGHGCLLACYPDGGVAVGGINLAPPGWADAWRHLAGTATTAPYTLRETVSNDQIVV